MAWFTSTQTYKRTVRDPDSQDEAEVTLRPLNAQDRAAIEDTLQMSSDGEGAITPQMKMGTMRMLSVTRAVVDWSIPGPKPNADTIAALHPDVFEQLWDAVTFGSEVDPTLPQTNGKPEKPVAASSSKTKRSS